MNDRELRFAIKKTILWINPKMLRNHFGMLKIVYGDTMNEVLDGGFLPEPQHAVNRYP